jgi:hypothetical protein
MAARLLEFYLTGQVVVAYTGRERFETVLYVEFKEPPQAGFRNAQTCICLPTEASAQAGAFLISLKKKSFSTDS